MQRKGEKLLKNEKLFMMNTLFPFNYSEIEFTQSAQRSKKPGLKKPKMEEKPRVVLFIYTVVKSPTISLEFCTPLKKYLTA